MTNNSQYIGEPAIIGGDLVKRGGDYERVFGLNNMILILVGTDSGLWSNLIEPPQSQIPGGLEELDGEPINSDFLNRHAAKVEATLNTMILNKTAKSIKCESFNPEVDRIEWTTLIELIDGRKFFFDSENCQGKFVGCA